MYWIWLKYSLLVCMLIAASLRDLQTREIPDYYHIAVVLIGFIQFDPFNSLMGLFCFLPFFIVAMFVKGVGIGGADIKFVTAFCFVIGLSKGMLAELIGVVFFVVYSLFMNKKGKKPYPMVSFLSIGCIVALFY